MGRQVKLQLLQLCLPLCYPTNCSTLGSSVHGILWARILDWAAVPSSRGSFWFKMEPVSLTSLALAGRFCTTSTTRLQNDQSKIQGGRRERSFWSGPTVIYEERKVESMAESRWKQTCWEPVKDELVLQHTFLCDLKQTTAHDSLSLLLSGSSSIKCSSQIPEPEC